MAEAASADPAAEQWVLDLAQRCHHDLKSLEHWALVEGRGKRRFVPPDDPRHPRHADALPSAA